jgi:hypothetical protein
MNIRQFPFNHSICNLNKIFLTISSINRRYIYIYNVTYRPFNVYILRYISDKTNQPLIVLQRHWYSTEQTF